MKVMRENIKEKKRIQHLALLSTFVTSYMGSAMNLSIPAISKEFGIGAAQATWIVNAYMLTCTILPLPCSKLAQRIPKTTILTTGLGVFLAGTAGGGLSGGMGSLIFFRGLQGVGTAMIYSSSMAVLVESAGESQRSKILAYSTAATYLGLSAGPVAGGMLNQILGWRWIFFATAGVSAVAFFRGVKIFALGMRTLRTQSRGGVKEEAAPILPLRWMRENPDFIYGCVISMINYGTNFVLNYQLSIYMQTCMGYSSWKAGMLLAISPIVQATLSIFIGKISGTKVSFKMLTACGMLGTAAVAAWFGMMISTMIGTMGLKLILAGLAAAGAACAVFSAPNTAQVFASAGDEKHTLASASLSTMRSLGHTLCMSAASLVTSAWVGTGKLQDAPPELMLSIMKITFFLLTGLCIVGFLIALKLKVCYNKG